MSESLTDERIREFREAFEVFDKDKNGYITIKELAELLKMLGFSPRAEEVNDMIQEVEIQGNGNVNFSEFIQLIARRFRDGDSEEELVEVFNIFDKDKNKLIGEKELKQVMTIIGEYLVDETITDAEVEDMINEADLDGDGYISWEEFEKIINKR